MNVLIVGNGFGGVKTALDLQHVIGDSADTPFSGMAQTAPEDAKFVASDIQNIKHGLTRAKYEPKHPLYVVPVGRNYAVLLWGRTKLTGWPSWLIRRVADLRLFLDLEPFEKAIKSWRYGHKRARFECHTCQREEINDKPS